MTALLDVNTLIALLDSQHVHHDLLRDWFENEANGGWATCPLTENGFIRIVSQPTYSKTTQFTPKRLCSLLANVKRHAAHQFWPDNVSFTDQTLFRIDRAGGHRAITDCYLLGLAVHHQGQLLTLDTDVRIAAVNTATQRNLRVLSSR